MLMASTLNNLGNVVGFYAAIGADYLTLGARQAIPFDHVYTNSNAQYDVTTGEFTCKVPGFYLFSSTIHEDSRTTDKLLQISFIKNGINVGSFMSIEHNSEVSKTILLELDIEDKVWLRNDRGGEVIDGSNWSSFVGVLIAGSQ